MGTNLFDSLEQRRDDRREVAGSKGTCPYFEGKHILVAVEIAVYADESENKAAGNFILSGYIASVRQWTKLRHRWAKVLQDHEVPEFHAHEFFNRNSGSSKNPYEGWPGEKAARFIGELALIIRTTALNPIGAALDVTAFKTFSKGERRFLTGAIMKRSGKWRTSGAPSRPYMVAFHWIIREALEKSKENTTVHFTFDASELKGLANVRFKEIIETKRWPGRERLGNIGFGDSAQDEALQVADMRTYFWNQAMVKRDAVSDTMFDMMFQVIKPKETIVFFGKDKLEELLAPVGPTQRSILKAEV